MSDVIRFVSKAELERQRLIREARAIYDSIFPPEVPAGGDAHDGSQRRPARGAAVEIQSE